MSYTTYDILENSTKSFYPFMAIVAYKSEETVYLESHNIDSNGQMLAGSPLSKECITELVSSFSQEQIITPYGYTPSTMLYFDNRIGNQRYVWYNPPQKRMMYFGDKLHIPNGEYFIPGIVYVVNGSSLNLYAFKGNKPKGRLYKAPFFNTTNGCVCLGIANIEYPRNPSFEDFISYWEKKFWLTKFTHLGGDMSPTKNSLTVVTKKSKDKFDEGELLEMDVTLKDILLPR